MAAQRHDAAARSADVAQQELQYRCGADELGAQGVLRPPDGIREAGGALAPGVLDDGAGEVVEVLATDPADVRHHLRGVAGVVPLDDLEYRPRVLQGFVALHAGVRERWTAAAMLVTGRSRRGGCAVRVAATRGLDLAVPLFVVRPRRRVVLPGFGVEAGEQTAEIFGVPELFVDQRSGVRVRDDIFLEPQVIGDYVVDQRAEQDHVRTGPDRDVLVRHRRCAGESRVDVNHPCAAGPGLLHPLEPDRVALGHVGALDDDAIGVGHVLE